MRVTTANRSLLLSSKQIIFLLFFLTDVRLMFTCIKFLLAKNMSAGGSQSNEGTSKGKCVSALKKVNSRRKSRVRNLSYVWEIAGTGDCFEI